MSNSPSRPAFGSAWPRLAVVCAVLGIAGCGTETTASDTIEPPASTRSLTLSVSGLPAEFDPVLHVGGSQGYARRLVGSGKLTGLAPGEYVLKADPVFGLEADYAAQEPERAVLVRAGAETPVSVVYSITTASLKFEATFLPNESTPTVHIEIQGPRGDTLGGGPPIRWNIQPGFTLHRLGPGEYEVIAPSLSIGPPCSCTWESEPFSQTLALSADVTISATSTRGSERSMMRSLRRCGRSGLYASMPSSRRSTWRASTTLRESRCAASTCALASS